MGTKTFGRKGIAGLAVAGLVVAAPGARSTETKTAETKPAALLAKGRDAFHAGRIDEATRLLSESLVAGAAGGGLDREGTADARHLLGRALLRASAFGDARIVLEAALEDAKSEGGSVLADHLTFLAAEAAAGLGEHAEAARLFGTVADDPFSPLVTRAAAARARALDRAGEPRRARAAWEDLLDRWPDAPEQWEARVSLARLLAAEGKDGPARQHLRTVLRLAPIGPSAREAEAALARLAPAPDDGAEVDDLEWLVDERRFSEAQPRLEALLERSREAGLRSLELRAAELLALTYRETRQHEAALGLYRWLEGNGGGGASPSRTAWMLASLGRHDEAEAVLLRAHGRRKSPAWWQEVGELREDFGRYAAAEEAWRSFLGRWTGHGDATRRLAWALLRQGKVDDAIPLLSKIAGQGRASRTWARYWIARGLQDAGRTDEARLRFEALAEDVPLDYYGILAWSRIADITGMAPRRPEGAPAGVTLVADSFGTSSPAEPPPFRSTWHWSPTVRDAAWTHAARPRPPEERAQALRNLAAAFGEAAPEARRALELDRLGFVDEARDELLVVDADRRELHRHGAGSLIGRARSNLLDNRSVRKAPGGASPRWGGRRSGKSARHFARVARSDGFTKALRDAQVALGDPYAMRKRVMETGGLGRAPSAADLARWRDAYPIGFPDLVRGLTARMGVPAYFLYAIMTIESTHHAHPVSVSDAYGLIQVIPRTGRRAALELGLEDFSPERLLDPAVGLQVGTHYLARLLRQFAGQEPLAAAAYNCGPHRVMSWLEAHPDRPLDVLVEEIPFSQARHYAMSAVEHTAAYRRTWHDEAHMYVANVLEPRFLPEPNY